MFNLFNCYPESTKFTIVASKKGASHIFKSTYNTSPIMAYSKDFNI